MNPCESKSHPLFQYNWEQPQSTRHMTFAIQVPAVSSGPSVPIPLKRIYKRQYWGYVDDKGRFIRIDRTNNIEKCPSCGAGPISWRAIRNKRANHKVSALRCNRQAKGACDHHGALRRVLRDRMMRTAAGNEETKRSMLRRPINAAMVKLRKAMELLRTAPSDIVHDFINQAPLPIEIREFLEGACQQSSDHPDPGSPGSDTTPQAPDSPSSESTESTEDVPEPSNGEEFDDKVKEEVKDEVEEEVKDEFKEEEVDTDSDNEIPSEPPTLTLLEPASQSPKQGPAGSGAVPALTPIPAPCVKRQSLSLARAAGEKVSVGFKMEEVENMVAYRSQRDTLLHNALGGWDARVMCFRKVKYVLALLREVERCGGAPIKHKNWTVMMKKLRASKSLKQALGGVPSTEVLNATLTAYRYIGTSLQDMLQNIPLTEHDLPARAQVRQMLDAIESFSAPYLRIEQASKHARHSVALSHPSVNLMHARHPADLNPVGLKRKYEHMGGVRTVMTVKRRVPYRPNPGLPASWLPPPPRMESAPRPMPRDAPGPCAPPTLNGIHMVCPPNRHQYK